MLILKLEIILFYLIFLPPANEVCEGNVLHLSVNHSVHRKCNPALLHAGIDPPPVNRITDRCKNISSKLRLRTVKIIPSSTPIQLV